MSSPGDSECDKGRLYIDFNPYSQRVNELQQISLIHYIAKLYGLDVKDEKVKRLQKHSGLSYQSHLENIKKNKNVNEEVDEYQAISILILIEQITNIRRSGDIELVEKAHRKLIRQMGCPLKLMVKHYYFLFSRLGRFTEADSYGKEIYEKHFSNDRDKSRQEFGILHYAFGHQTLSADLMYKKNKYYNANFEILTTKEYVANGFLGEINKKIFPESKNKFENVLIEGNFSVLDLCGIIKSKFAWHPIVLSEMNYELAINNRLRSVYADFFSNKILNSDLDQEHENFLNERKYVTIYTRQPNFKGEPRWRYHYNTYRQANPKILKKSILYLISIGYSVVRIGDPIKCDIGIESDFYWDYAGSNYKSDLNDIFIVKNAEFCITNGLGGGYYLPYCFDKPNLLINFPFTHKAIWHPYIRLVIKPMKKYGIFKLNYEDYFSEGINMLEDGYKMRENFIFPSNLDGDTILESIIKFEKMQKNRRIMWEVAVKNAFWCSRFKHDSPVALLLDQM